MYSGFSDGDVPNPTTSFDYPQHTGTSRGVVYGWNWNNVLDCDVTCVSNGAWCNAGTCECVQSAGYSGVPPNCKPLCSGCTGEGEVCVAPNKCECNIDTHKGAVGACEALPVAESGVWTDQGFRVEYGKYGKEVRLG